MRETTNLKLTQFDGSDVPNWLDQYNSDNLKIDTAIGEQAVKNTEFSNTTGNLQTQITNNRNQIDENTQDIANIKKDVINIKGGSDSSIGALEKKVTTTDQTVTTLNTAVGSSDFSNVGASITEVIGNTPIKGSNTITNDLKSLHDSISSAEDQSEKIEKIEKTIGTYPISEIDNTITGAIGNNALKTGESLSESVNDVYDIAKSNENNITTINKQLQKIGTNFQIKKEQSVLHATSTNIELVTTTSQEGHYFATVQVSFAQNSTGYRNVEIIRKRNNSELSLGVFLCNATSSGATIFTIATIPFDIVDNDLFYAKVQHNAETSIKIYLTINFIRLTE